MKTKTSPARALLAAAFLLSLSPAFAAEEKAKSAADQPKTPAEWEARREARSKEVAEKLDLTPEQKKALDAQREKRRAETSKIFESMRADREAIRTELEKPQMDLAKVKQLHERTKSYDAQLADYQLETILQTREILTHEQFKKFQELRRDFRDRDDRVRKDGEKAKAKP